MQSNAGSGRIFFLQALRGAAAVIVMVYHLALKFWTTHDALAVSFPWMAGELHDAAFWLEGIGAACARMNLDLGCFGVALFFLISGFVISLSLDAEDPVFTSVIHEAVHRIRETDPDAYTQLSDLVQTNMTDEVMGFSLGTRSQLYGTENRDSLTEELVADAREETIADIGRREGRICTTLDLPKEE